MPDGVILLSALFVAGILQRCGKSCISREEGGNKGTEGDNNDNILDDRNTAKVFDWHDSDGSSCNTNQRHQNSVINDINHKNQEEKQKILSGILNSLLWVPVDDDGECEAQKYSQVLKSVSGCPVPSDILQNTTSKKSTSSLISINLCINTGICLKDIDSTDSQFLFQTKDVDRSECKCETRTDPTTTSYDSRAAFESPKMSHAANDGVCEESSKENVQDDKPSNTLHGNTGRQSSSSLLRCKTNSVQDGPSKTKVRETSLMLQKQFPVATRVKVDTAANGEKNQHAVLPSTIDLYQSSRFCIVTIGSVVDWDDDALVVHLDGHRDTTRVSPSLYSVIDESCLYVGGTGPASTFQEKRKKRRATTGATRRVPKKSHDQETTRSDDPDRCMREHDHFHFQPSRTIKDALKDGGWTLKRSSHHLIYRRDIVDTSGKVREIAITMGKTNSDHRGDKNTLARLNKFNRKYANRIPIVVVGRHCATCGDYKPKTDYSAKQWNTGKNKCKECCLVLA